MSGTDGGVVEKRGANGEGGVQHGPQRNVIALGRVKNQVRLKAKAPVARLEVIGPLTDLRKVGDQPEGANKPGVVGAGLICAETFFGKVVDVDQGRAGAPRET